MVERDEKRQRERQKETEIRGGSDRNKHKVSGRDIKRLKEAKVNRKIKKETLKGQ